MLYRNKGLGIDNITTDASNDIERATELARNMVTRWAMADDTPFVSLESGNENTFLGNAPRSGCVHSGQTLEYIDTEYKKIITRNYQKAEKILKENETILEQMAKALIDLETLDKDQIIHLMNGGSAQDLPHLLRPG